MPVSEDVQLKIEALVEGLQNVAALSCELEALEKKGKKPVGDNTAALRAGADSTGLSIQSLTGKIGKLIAVAGWLSAIGAFLKASADEVTDYDTRSRPAWLSVW